MQSFLRCMGEWNSVNKGIKKTFTLSLKLYKNSLCFLKLLPGQGCQNRDPDRKIARFYDPTSPKRLKS